MICCQTIARAFSYLGDSSAHAMVTVCTLLLLLNRYCIGRFLDDVTSGSRWLSASCEVGENDPKRLLLATAVCYLPRTKRY